MLKAVAKTTRLAQSDDGTTPVLLCVLIACLLNIVLILTSPEIAAAVALSATY